MNAIGSKAALRDGVEAVSTEAAGAVEVIVVMQDETDAFLLDALQGNREAQQLLPAVVQALARIDAASGHKPVLCSCCPRPIRPGGRFNLAVAIPARDDPTRAIGLAVCGRCATEPAGVLAKAVDGFRRIWPDLRHLAVHPGSGRA